MDCVGAVFYYPHTSVDEGNQCISIRKS